MAVPHQPKNVICVSGEDICSAPMTTKVPNLNNVTNPLDGRTDHDVTHMTSTHLTKDASGKVNGGRIALYTRPLGHPTDANGEPLWQLAGTSSDGGKTWDSDGLALTDAQKANLNVSAFDPNYRQSMGSNVLYQTQIALKKENVTLKATGDILPTTQNQAPTDNDQDNTATDADVGTQDSAQISETNPGTRKDFGKGLTYPSTLDLKSQDTILFSMLEYSPKKLTSSGGLLGSGNRADRKSIGSVILPIPNGIKDADKVNWGEDSMDAGALALAAIAFAATTDGTTGANAELKKIQAGVKGIGADAAKKAIGSYFTGAATGKDKGKFMSRATGQIMNPNMELLFTGPSLRDFSFTFLLAPRDHKEAMVVMQIIRFFKQGMLPIRSKSNLFLKAPNTFQLTYKTKGEIHPYLNSFKECALKSCDVNYTPENSYSTYTDSVMTAYSMTLAFGELEPIYNDDYGSGLNQEFPSHLNFTSTTGVDVQNLTDEERDDLAGTIVQDKTGTDSYILDSKRQSFITGMDPKNK